MRILLSLSREADREPWERLLSPLGMEVLGGYLPPWEAEAEALILAGGGDPAPLPGEDGRRFRKVDRERDRREELLLERFMGERKPVLGICRGHQLIVRALGGCLFGELPTVRMHQGEEDLWHGVRIRRGTWLREVYGGRAVVNSNHHQGVKRLGRGMRGVARSEDGLWEAAVHRVLPLCGVQWHPERMENGERFFGAFRAWAEKSPFLQRETGGGKGLRGYS